MDSTMIRWVILMAAIMLCACTALSTPSTPPRFYSVPRASNPEEQEVLDNMVTYLGAFNRLEYKGLSDWYTQNAIIYTKISMTPKEFEKDKRWTFWRLRSRGLYFEFSIQNIEPVRDDYVVITNFYLMKSGPKRETRYFTWTKISNSWKISRHHVTHPSRDIPRTWY